MSRMFTIAVGGVALVGAAALGVRIAFDRRIAREVDSLLAEAQPANGRTIVERDLERLPEPVQRWLRFSKVIGTEWPATVRLEQHGDFRLEGGGWMPFSAEQYFTVDPPAFLWKASFRMAPLVRIAGRDQYRGGEGSIDMRLASLVPVASKAGGGLDQGALLRFLGEVQWFPAAALADYITWEAVDATTARATMTYGGLSAAMTLTFDADGRIVESRAMRYNDARGRNELWINRNDSEREFGGIRIAVSGEARWEYDSGPFPYIRWRITALEQNRPARFAQ